MTDLCDVILVAAANNHVGCLTILKEFSALYIPNNSGNLPIRKFFCNIIFQQLTLRSFDSMSNTVMTALAECVVHCLFRPF
jgi:hypothetical protein